MTLLEVMAHSGELDCVPKRWALKRAGEDVSVSMIEGTIPADLRQTILSHKALIVDALREIEDRKAAVLKESDAVAAIKVMKGASDAV